MPLCTSSKCTSKIDTDDHNCLPPCSGLIVTSLTKQGIGKDFEGLIAEEIASYNNYMKWFKFPTGLKGLYNIICN